MTDIAPDKEKARCQTSDFLEHTLSQDAQSDRCNTTGITHTDTAKDGVA